MESEIRKILKENNIQDGKIQDKVTAKLSENTEVQKHLQVISDAKRKIMKEAHIYKEKEEFKDTHLVIKNANSKQPYEFRFEMEQCPNIRIKDIVGLDAAGLRYENNTIMGTPVVSNAYDLNIEFFHVHDEQNIDLKKIQLFVNADPKDLWKNIPSDPNDIFSKPDEYSFKGRFLDKKIVVASKRGRSHAHEGRFREDDFAVNVLPADWSIVSVGDGAGSAKMARYGSQLTVSSINDFFQNREILNEIEKNIKTLYTGESELNETSKEIKKEAQQNVIKLLYEGVTHVYHVLQKAADEHSFSIKELHSTLIFALAKKFEFGYIILTFGVGDSPLNLIDKDFSRVKLMNKMDVGEVGGGTYFITMKEIFNNGVISRFGIACVDDFSNLILMTDGIYDPKFITENKLEDLESWKGFFEDLNGNNEDGVRVDFYNHENTDLKLLEWMDFWSRGNHDDRTLAIIY